MNNFPRSVNSVPDHRSPVEKSGAIIEMKGDDRDSAGDILNQEILGLNIHVWRRQPIAANLLEDDFEGAFEFCTSTGSCGNRARIEDVGVVLE